MNGLTDRITRAPRAYDPRRGDEAAARIGAAPELIRGAAGSSPYLARLVEREAEWLSSALARAPEEEMAALLTPLDDISPREAAGELRRRKRRAALLIGLADLGGVWDLPAVTGAISDFADFAAHQGFRVSLGQERTGPLSGLSPEQAGLIVIAMGKGGARELNYSSDIDLILLWDNERHDEDDLLELKSRWNKITQRVIKLLSETTAEGYVFRTDLRLRPNPSVTPVCVPLAAAERYYESMGRTWERAAFIKARAAGGDIAAGEAFLKGMTPFIWRRHLDFAALEDINDIRAKIRDAKGLSAVQDLPGYNLKLGPGGIREIEFFAQTQQLAFGGRDPALRARGTCAALDALSAAGKIDAEDAAALKLDYAAHRETEHRLQMIEDAQTHAMPVAEAARDQVAALGGWPDRAAMEAEVAGRLAAVRARVNRFFARSGAPQSSAPALDIESLPFERPDMVRGLAERWSVGGIAATRDQRARRKIRALAPVILKKLSVAGDPDEAVLQFDKFLAGLPAGVQLFSLFEANPHLLDLLAEICATAPSLAEYLSRNARVFDAVLDADFFQPLPALETLRDELETSLEGEDDYETILDGVRRWAKERKFQLGVQTLKGVAGAREAGRGFSDIAEACLRVLKPRVEAEFARRHGPPPGRGAAVIGMGKLGSREMTATSDLDLIVVYDGAGATQSDGPKPLTIGLYFARLTQKLVSALTTLTAEGALYEVDMRLRPSGTQGPVAVGLESFRNYQVNEAWTWEHMALTRARVVAGDSGLAADIDAVMETVLTEARDAEKVRADIAEMRGRLAKAHAAARDELWSLKQGAGGLMDIEFALIAAMLSAGRRYPRAPEDALDALAADGALTADEAEALKQAHGLQTALQQVERVATTRASRPDQAGSGLQAALAQVGGVGDFAALETLLAARRAAAREIVDRRLGAA